MEKTLGIETGTRASDIRKGVAIIANDRSPREMSDNRNLAAIPLHGRRVLAKINENSLDLSVPQSDA
jgi:hypothetical protein